jgi:hypothetical protein
MKLLISRWSPEPDRVTSPIWTARLVLSRPYTFLGDGSGATDHGAADHFWMAERPRRKRLAHAIKSQPTAA